MQTNAMCNISCTSACVKACVIWSGAERVNWLTAQQPERYISEKIARLMLGTSAASKRAGRPLTVTISSRLLKREKFISHDFFQLVVSLGRSATCFCASSVNSPRCVVCRFAILSVPVGFWRRSCRCRRWASLASTSSATGRCANQSSENDRFKNARPT